jgi:hypothetical protein
MDVPDQFFQERILGSRSVPKFHGSGTLVWTDQHIRYIAAMLLPN